MFSLSLRLSRLRMRLLWIWRALKRQIFVHNHTPNGGATEPVQRPLWTGSVSIFFRVEPVLWYICDHRTGSVIFRKQKIAPQNRFRALKAYQNRFRGRPFWDQNRLCKKHLITEPVLIISKNAFLTDNHNHRTGSEGAHFETRSGSAVTRAVAGRIHYDF